MGTLSFTSVKGLRPKLNRFNMSYMKAFPGTMGKLIPIHSDFCIPGTWVELYPSLFTRTNALVRPVIDNISTYCHFWKIPLRLIDKKFTKFIGGEIDPEEYNPAHFTPKNFFDSLVDFQENNNEIFSAFESLPFGTDFTSDHFFEELLNNYIYFNSSLLDLLGYFGDGSFWSKSDIVLNLYEFKAYLLLLKVWYQNENITIDMPCYTTYRGEDYTFNNDTSLNAAIEDFIQLEGNISGEFAAFYLDMVGNFGTKAIFNHAWAKDYFTSALPNTQYGEEVTIPLATSAPVTGDLTANGQSLIGNPNGLQVGVDGGVDSTLVVNAVPTVSTGQGKLIAGTSDINSLSGTRAILKDVEGLQADLSEATSISILELRIAETLQVYKERIMRAGRKYREYLKMFFNVVSSDARLQDPEWLGGGKVALQIGDVEQTSATNDVTPQGNLAGKGTQFGGNMTKITTWCEEWCIILGVGYMQPKARYCQGIERNKMKTNDLYDWFNPTFERIGEQPIFTAELFAGLNVGKDDIFGYQRRYAEYTFKNDQMHGAFRNSLSNWTAGLRIFDTKPVLNQQFIYVQPDVFDRIFAVAEAEQDGNVLFWWQHAYYKKQPVSKFGTPGLHLY